MNINSDNPVKALDLAQYGVLVGKNSAFMAPLLCAMDCYITNEPEVKTACTNGEYIKLDEKFFMGLPPKSRITLLRHELDHVARFHMLRGENFNQDIWNIACDIYINNALYDEGYSFEGLENGFRNPSMNGLAEEEIYNQLMKNPPVSNPNYKDIVLGSGKEPLTSSEKQAIINKVVMANEQAKKTFDPNNSGRYSEIIDTFLTPIVPWERLLRKFFTDMEGKETSWKKRNRRFRHIYMPSRVPESDRLAHLAYYVDVSGSVSSKDIVRFNSELKHIWDEFQPQKLTVALFDTQITKEIVFEDEQSFDKIEVVGRGGTSLQCVREHIEENKPTAAVIFSDLYCEPIQPLTSPIPIIWIVVDNKKASVPFGEKIYI